MRKQATIALVLLVLLMSALAGVEASAAQIPIDRCEVTFSKEYAYTGNGITPTPKVVYKGAELKKDTDYYIYYANNVNVGTATVTLVGLGKYTGSTTGSFVIKKGTQEIRADNIGATYGDAPVYISAIAKSPLTYKSSDPAVCTATEVGMVTIVGAGSAKITIVAEGNNNMATGKKVITVKVAKARPKVTAYGGLVKKGKSLDLKAETSSGGKLTYTSSNEKIAKVSSRGILKAKKKGKATITVKSAATENYKAGSAKVEVEVN